MENCISENCRQLEGGAKLKLEMGRGSFEAWVKCFVTFPSFAIMRHGAIYKVSK